MNRINLLSLLVAVLEIVTLDAFGAGALVLGTPISMGDGCKPGTTSITLSPQGDSLSVIFDDFKAEVGKGLIQDLKSCIVDIPLTFPAGTFVAVIQADYRGFNFLPAGAVSEFRTDYEFDSNVVHNQLRTHLFRGPLNGEFIETNRERARSRCGGTVHFKINTGVRVRSNTKGDQAFAQVDTFDASGLASFSSVLAAVPTFFDPIRDRGKRKNRFHIYQLRFGRCGDSTP